MMAYKEMFLNLEARLKTLNLFVKEYLPEVTFYRQVTIKINFDNIALCFNNLVSWSYSFIFESLSKNYDFLITQSKKLNANLSNNIIEFKQSIHYHRTFNQHSQFDINRLSEFNNYVEGWFQVICDKNEPELDEEWNLCIEKILSDLNEVISCFEKIVKESFENEFSHIFIREWKLIVLRSFEKYRYEIVLVRVLDDHGLSTKLDKQAFIDRYLEEWKRNVELLPDHFEFDEEVYAIIQKSIAKAEIIPINGSSLISAGIPRGPQLGKCIEEARKEFYRNPCQPDDLLAYIVNWYKTQFKET